MPASVPDVPHALEVDREDIAGRRAEEVAEVAAHYLFRGEAGQGEGRLVHRQQPAFHVVGADQPLAGLDQVTVAPLALGELGLGILQVGDVHRHAADERRPVGAREWKPRHLPMLDRAIGP